MNKLEKLKPMICDKCDSCIKEIKEVDIPIYATSRRTIKAKRLTYFCRIKMRFIWKYKTSCKSFSNVKLDIFI